MSNDFLEYVSTPLTLLNWLFVAVVILFTFHMIRCFSYRGWLAGRKYHTIVRTSLAFAILIVSIFPGLGFFAIDYPVWIQKLIPANTFFDVVLVFIWMVEARILRRLDKKHKERLDKEGESNDKGMEYVKKADGYNR